MSCELRAPECDAEHTGLGEEDRAERSREHSLSAEVKAGVQGCSDCAARLAGRRQRPEARKLPAPCCQEEALLGAQPLSGHVLDLEAGGGAAGCRPRQ